MRVLIDESAPKALKKYLLENGHDCSTVQDMGWSGKQNGELLTLAHTNRRYQQNLSARKIGVIVLQARSNRLSVIRQLFPGCLAVLSQAAPGEVILINE